MSAAVAGLAIGHGAGLWGQVSQVSHLLAALACALAGALLARQRDRYQQAGGIIVAALGLTALWDLAVMVVGPLSTPVYWLMALRNLAFLASTRRLFACDGRDTSVAQVRPVLIVLVAVDLLLPVSSTLMGWQDPTAAHGLMLFHLTMTLAMLGVVGSLVLVHNLYVGAAPEARPMLLWPALAMALVWGFELNLYTVAYLGGIWPNQLAALHGLVDLAYAVTITLGTIRRQDQTRLRPSRTVTFHSVSLVIIGVYLCGMIAVAQWLADAGGDYARWMQFGFLIIATTAALLLLPSRRMRGWMRVTLTKHLFQHRYDYRAEWLRFTRTIGAKTQESPLHERAIRALADITDSPAGLLLTPDDQGDLALAARWLWPTIEVPASAFPMTGIAYLERQDFIIDLDALRMRAVVGEREANAPVEALAVVPPWLRDDARAWALVPLLHFDRLVGAVVLARPAQARKLDWEDFDLLRVVGQQLASYLAEHSGQEALAEAARFDDFHRRIAFVMHDIKNLASQFGLLARNAERHADNPEFRADMLVTLRNSADKLNALVARLSRYGAGSVDKVEPVEVGPIAQALARRFVDRHVVSVIESDACTVVGQHESLEQVLAHLVQNGVEASANGTPVFIAINREGPWCRIEIVDSGHGMSPEFLRTRLFKPFDSSKPGGFGVGAYEARELVRAMRGRMEVESREGVGTRFVVRLPLAEAGGMLSDTAPDGRRIA